MVGRGSFRFVCLTPSRRQAIVRDLVWASRVYSGDDAGPPPSARAVHLRRVAEKDADDKNFETVSLLSQLALRLLKREPVTDLIDPFTRVVLRARLGQYGRDGARLLDWDGPTGFRLAGNAGGAN